MAQTDSPLKDLVESNIHDFAAWLLDTEISFVQTLNVEFTGQDARVDRLFQVTLASGNQCILHIEFQGRSTKEPIRLRVLDYLTRIVRTYPDIQLHSVVFYVGNGVGAKDMGEHQIFGLDGKVTLRWHYQVIHLWKIKAEELLALNRPGLLALIGQTQIDDPFTVIPAVVDRIRHVADEETRRHLIIDLIALLDDQEIIDMIETMLKDEGLLMDTPFLRRVRIEERHRMQRQDVLNAIVWRFDPPSSLYQQIENKLLTIDDAETLTLLLKTAVQTDTIDSFQIFLQSIKDYS